MAAITLTSLCDDDPLATCAICCVTAAVLRHTGKSPNVPYRDDLGSKLCVAALHHGVLNSLPASGVNLQHTTRAQ